MQKSDTEYLTAQQGTTEFGEVFNTLSDKDKDKALDFINFLYFCRRDTEHNQEPVQTQKELNLS
jgi:hypothetical protein